MAAVVSPACALMFAILSETASSFSAPVTFSPSVTETAWASAMAAPPLLDHWQPLPPRDFRRGIHKSQNAGQRQVVPRARRPAKLNRNHVYSLVHFRRGPVNFPTIFLRIVR